MENKNLRNIRLCCIVAFVFCFIWAGVMVNYFVADLIALGSWPFGIDWSTNIAAKVITLVCFLLGTAFMISICITGVHNIFKGLRENKIFPKNNVGLLFCAPVADFVYQLGVNNLPLLWNDELFFQIGQANLITPCFLVFFAFMYKAAADAVEQDRLTI